VHVYCFLKATDIFVNGKTNDDQLNNIQNATPEFFL